MANPYKILGVAKNAPLDQIEAAYRRNVMKHHPDRGGDVWAFEQVHAAYERIKAERCENQARDSQGVTDGESGDPVETADATEMKSTTIPTAAMSLAGAVFGAVAGGVLGGMFEQNVFIAAVVGAVPGAIVGWQTNSEVI